MSSFLLLFCEGSQNGWFPWFPSKILKNGVLTRKKTRRLLNALPNPSLRSRLFVRPPNSAGRRAQTPPSCPCRISPLEDKVNIGRALPKGPAKCKINNWACTSFQGSHYSLPNNTSFSNKTFGQNRTQVQVREYQV